MLFGQPFRKAARHLHIIIGIGVGDRRNLDQFGALQPQQVLFFLALRIGNDDDRLIAERIADQGETDAGIAGCALDDEAARPQSSASDGVLDDEESGAVLHRAAGILEFSLA